MSEGPTEAWEVIKVSKQIIKIEVEIEGLSSPTTRLRLSVCVACVTHRVVLPTLLLIRQHLVRYGYTASISQEQKCKV